MQKKCNNKCKKCNNECKNGWVSSYDTYTDRCTVAVATNAWDKTKTIGQMEPPQVCTEIFRKPNSSDIRLV